MTDNEIIKALENEAKSTEYVDSDYCDGVDLTLIKSAIDLIKHQKAEIENTKAKIKICAEVIERQGTEIERLNKKVEKLSDVISGTGNSVICVNDVESAEGYTRKFDEVKMQQIVSKIFEKPQREEIKMTDKEIIIEKTFSEELPYFKERIKEVFDNYNNPNGNEDPLYICVLRDSNRIVRKAEEEITRQKTEIDELKHEREVLIEDIHYSADKINEQLEEIERLQADNKTLENVIKNTFLKKAGLDIDSLAEIKAEAYKDFAECLKEEWFNNDYDSPDVDFDGFVDNFLKEMIDK